MHNDPIRVIVIDDHLIVRKGTRAFLAEIDGIEVIGDAGSGREAIRLVKSLCPDLILIDLMMPEMDGIQTVQQISSLKQDVRILIMTSFIAEDKIVAALMAGAHSYLLKDAPPDDLGQTIIRTYRGESILQQHIARKIFDAFKSCNSENLLTPIEMEILTLTASGNNEREAAQKLGISEVELREFNFQIIQKLHQLFDL